MSELQFMDGCVHFLDSLLKQLTLILQKTAMSILMIVGQYTIL